MKHSQCFAFLLSSFTMTFTCCSAVHAVTWQNIRDGIVHFRTDMAKDQSNHSTDNHRFSLSWKDAWISEAQTDHVYLLKPNGTLAQKYILKPENTPGTETLSTKEIGDYQLNITGYNFRYVNFKLPDNIPSVFEPVKVHKSIRLSANESLYFRVPAFTEFSFCGKYFSGPTQYGLSPVNEKNAHNIQLRLNKHKHHWEFDCIRIKAKSQTTTWRLQWNKPGKAAFWLDGTHNLFAQRPDALFIPKHKPGNALIKLSHKILGTTPAIGVAFPFTNPPASSYALIDKWSLRSANHYFFSDALSITPEHDLSFLDVYLKRFNILQNNLILSRTGRRPVINDLEDTEAFLLKYLETRNRRYNNFDNSIAFADEPNLNYDNYGHFEQHFVQLARAIKQHKNPNINRTALAVPQSSRFLNGPTRRGAINRKGIDWARHLIEDYGQWIDAISWHEWLVRDLLDTSRYEASVNAAADLVEQFSGNFAKKPKLVIAQTNISSGQNISPYTQDTHFAALWWASVVIQSSKPGKLDQLVWFKAADDETYRKGLVSLDATNGQIREKPVSHAMHFINKHIGQWVLSSDDQHPEVDLLATLSADKRTLKLLGVNKSKRRQTLEISTTLQIGPGVFTTLQEGDQPVNGTTTPDKITIPLRGESIFAMDFPILPPSPF